MKERGCQKQHLENASSYLPSGIEKSTDWLFKKPLRNVVTVLRKLLSALSIQRYTTWRKKNSLSQSSVIPPRTNDAEHDESTIVSPTQERRLYRASWIFRADCCPGNRRKCLKTPATSLMAEPVAYLFLSSDNAEAWLGDIAEKRAELYEMGYAGWGICCYDVLWSLDLSYRAIAYRIGLLLGK